MLLDSHTVSFNVLLIMQLPCQRISLRTEPNMQFLSAMTTCSGDAAHLVALHYVDRATGLPRHCLAS